MTTLDFWRGPAGDAYHARNRIAEEELADARRDMWDDILLTLKDDPVWIAEIGAGNGQNLRALSRLLAHPLLIAIEPNAGAREALAKQWKLGCDVIDGTATAIPLPDRSVDLAFTSGVLIHVPPDDLLQACREIHRIAKRWIVCVEYFSAAPREVIYRGESGKLWSRDFGGFFLDNFPDMKPIGCGFAWKRMTGLDDLTWVSFAKEAQ